MKKLKLIIILIILILISTVIFTSKKNTKPLEKKDFKSIEISNGERVYSYNSYIYIYGKAGIKIMKDEKLIKSDNFSLENPYVVKCYNKIAIGDKNGKVIRVYSNEGRMYTVNTNHNILGFTINKNGFLAVILKNDINYEIEVYNDNGEKAYSIKDISYEEGVPISISISEDNKILSVSHIKTTSAMLISNIVFYSMEDNKNFGGITKKNQLVGIVKFINKTNLVCISDKEIFIIKCNAKKTDEQMKEIYLNPLNNILKNVAFLDDGGYAICYGQPITNSEETLEENTVVFYNNSGGEVGKYYRKEQNINSISSSKFGVILQDKRLFTAINLAGKKIWEYQATQDIKDVLFYDTNKKILIVTNNEIKIVKIDKFLVDKQIDKNNISNNIEIENEKHNNKKINTKTTETKESTSSTQTTTNEKKER